MYNYLMESANLAKLNDFKNIFKITSLYNIGLEESMIKSLICDNKKFESVQDFNKRSFLQRSTWDNIQINIIYNKG